MQGAIITLYELAVTLFFEIGREETELDGCKVNTQNRGCKI